MNKEEIEKQLKLSKRQNKDERYKHLCTEFNDINYCVDLEKYTNKLQQENKKYKEVIDKAISKLGRYADELTSNGNAYAVCVDLLDILKEVE